MGNVPLELWETFRRNYGKKWEIGIMGRNRLTTYVLKLELEFGIFWSFLGAFSSELFGRPSPSCVLL
jgi:hypothetical protein